MLYIQNVLTFQPLMYIAYMTISQGLLVNNTLKNIKSANKSSKYAKYNAVSLWNESNNNHVSNKMFLEKKAF